MEIEIVLMRRDETVQFNVNLKSSAPDVVCIDNEYFQMVGSSFRPAGNGKFLYSVIYKPAVFAQLTMPQEVQIFKRATG